MIFLCNCDTNLLLLFIYHLEIDLFFDWLTHVLNVQEKIWVVKLQYGIYMLQTLKKGDIIIGTVLTKSVSGMMLKVLCTDGEGAKCVSDVNVKVWELVFFYPKAVCCSDFSFKLEGISVWSTVMPVLRINLEILQKVVFILTVVGFRSLGMYVLKCLKFILEVVVWQRIKITTANCMLLFIMCNWDNWMSFLLGVHCTYRVYYVCYVN